MQKNLSCSSAVSLLWPPSSHLGVMLLQSLKATSSACNKSLAAWLLTLWNQRFSKRFMHWLLNVKINSANTFFRNDYLDITNFLQNMPVSSSISEEQVLSVMSPSRCTFHCSLSTQKQLFLSVWQNMGTGADTEMPDLPFLPNLTSAGMKQLTPWGVQALAGGTPVQCSHPSHCHCLILFSFLSIKENIVPMPFVKQSAARTLQYTLQHTTEPYRLNVKRSGCKGRENSRCWSCYRWV